MSLEDMIQEERSKDEGLKKAKEHRESLEQARRAEPDTVRVCLDCTATIRDPEVKRCPNCGGRVREQKTTGSVFGEKIKESQKRDPRPNYRRRKERKQKLHKSQREQRSGLFLGDKDFALVRCNASKYRYSHGCHGLIVVENGQKTSKCPKCGRRRWLSDTVILEKSDDKPRLQQKLNNMLNETGRCYK